MLNTFIYQNSQVKLSRIKAYIQNQATVQKYLDKLFWNNKISIETEINKTYRYKSTHFSQYVADRETKGNKGSISKEFEGLVATFELYP